MIVVERYDDLRESRKSDAGVKIRQIETGAVYDAAIDLIPCRYHYEETDIPVETDEATVEDYASVLTEMGVIT